MNVVNITVNIINILIVLLAIGMFRYGRSYGIIGLLIAVVFILIIRAMQSWDTVLLMFQYVETKIWGKPLDRKFWKKGERAAFPKIVWRRK